MRHAELRSLASTPFVSSSQRDCRNWFFAAVSSSEYKIHLVSSSSWATTITVVTVTSVQPQPLLIEQAQQALILVCWKPTCPLKKWIGYLQTSKNVLYKF